jgi:hypothetical protein
MFVLIGLSGTLVGPFLGTPYLCGRWSDTPPRKTTRGGAKVLRTTNVRGRVFCDSSPPHARHPLPRLGPRRYHLLCSTSILVFSILEVVHSAPPLESRSVPSLSTAPFEAFDPGPSTHSVQGRKANNHHPLLAHAKFVRSSCSLTI